MTKKLAKEFIFQNQALQQQLCVNYMKLYQEKLNFADSSYDDKNDGHTEEDPDYINHEINKTALSDSANLLGLSPIKAVGKQHRAGYGKQLRLTNTITERQIENEFNSGKKEDLNFSTRELVHLKDL